MRGNVLLIALASLLAACTGCLAPPNIFHPGTEAHQQARAQVFDPYPENEPGPPVVGARPQGYENPPAEVTRVQPRLGEPIFAPAPQTQPPVAAPKIAAPPAAITCPPTTQP